MAGERILIVEDHEKSRKLLRDVLRVKGYSTVETVTAEDGLAVARAEPPALVLMDIQLPGMDGIAAMRELRKHPRTRGIPVVAVTASAMPEDRRKILSAEFDGYATKPIRVRELLALVARLIDAGRPPSGKGPTAPARSGGRP